MSDLILETPRLLLRTSNEDMTAATLDFYRRNAEEFEHIEPISHPDFYTEDFHRRLLRTERELIQKRSMFRVWIFLRSFPSIPIGTVSVHNIRYGDFSDGEIGYKIDSAFRRQGFAREAISKVMELMTSPEYGLHRIDAMVLPSNEPSIRLLESLGFVREGLLRHNVRIHGEWKSHYLYSYLNE